MDVQFYPPTQKTTGLPVDSARGGSADENAQKGAAAVERFIKCLAKIGSLEENGQARGVSIHPNQRLG